MKRAVVVAGLGFGDEGKGTTVEALTHRLNADLVIRYNGGAQAAHNVVTTDGKHHTFAQFGSGTLLGVRTFLSEHVLVEPFALCNEAAHLVSLGVADPLAGLFIDRRAPVITPYHILANRYRETQRGNEAHGSCGMGIGETRQDALEHPDDVLRVGDLLDDTAMFRKLARAQDRLRAEFPHEDEGRAFLLTRALYRDIAKRLRIVDGAWFADQMRRSETTVFEGAQGVLLDQEWGFQPHTTWSATTFEWADDLLRAVEFDGRVLKFGVTRAYLTRHGAGPMPTEHRSRKFAEPHNVGGFAGSFRTGDLDLTLLRYAVEVCGGIDALAITHLDRAAVWQVCTSWGSDLADSLKVGDRTTYERQAALTDELRRLDRSRFWHTRVGANTLCELLSEIVEAPVKLRSSGPTLLHKVWT